MSLPLSSRALPPILSSPLSSTTSIFKSSTSPHSTYQEKNPLMLLTGGGKRRPALRRNFCQRFYQSLTYLNKWKYSNPNALAYYMEEGKYVTSSPSCHPTPPKVEEEDTKRHYELQIKTNKTYPYTPIRMGKSETLTVSMWSNKKSYSPLVGI